MTTSQHERIRIKHLDELLRCAGCGRRPEQIGGYVMPTLELFCPDPPEDLKIPIEEFAAAHWAAADPEERVAAVRRYVRVQEGTLNPRTGAFACDECYIIAGMPSSPKGWIVPDGGEWPNHKEQFEQFAHSKGMKVPSIPQEESS
jgi:hypothetical protein